jgi:hypothetical protein
MKRPSWKAVLGWLLVLAAWAPAQINGQINGGSGSGGTFNQITSGTNTNALVIGTGGTFNVTQADGTTTNVVPVTVSNSTAASSGNQAYSPSVVQCGNGWGTTGASSQPVCFSVWVAPSQATIPTGTWLLQESVNGSAYANAMSVGTNGVVTASSFDLGESAVSVPNGLSLNGAANTWALSANNVSTLTSTNALIKATVPLSIAGTTFTVASGTGACATTSTLVGGVQAGNLTCTGTTGASTVTLTLAATTTAYSCTTRDVTTVADTGSQTGAISTTSVTFTYAAVAANDVIQFSCMGY